jgi:ABC-type Zn2+ transport system substrate-binding protein/surface adhesin
MRRRRRTSPTSRLLHPRRKKKSIRRGRSLGSLVYAELPFAYMCPAEQMHIEMIHTRAHTHTHAHNTHLHPHTHTHSLTQNSDIFFSLFFLKKIGQEIGTALYVAT